MGLLSEGSPLSWEETKKHADHVRKHGIQQFINQYNKLKDRKKDVLYWGDEVEYMLVKFDDENKVARVSLKAEPVLERLQQTEHKYPHFICLDWVPVKIEISIFSFWWGGLIHSSVTAYEPEIMILSHKIRCLDISVSY
ncbi:hypothetical protein KUTeg_000770 [Tegillarca granosa]|uniref:Glutamate--cysteine ligase n=1 Tax=Tegillarca granosa TaxID=220873 RepID=A0ABQ9FYI5_TEGGR|nr:hypothetical protein KUTeg_000770 [Tegillarca granosa]